MFGQLLEAIVYLYSHRINDAPHLVLSDFGCALATGSWKVRYDVDTVHLGGNLALRAPEIRCAHPAPNNWVDFHMADLWAAATIGYEIFTRQQTNPFYGHMRSDQYVECELPALPKKVDCSVKMVIRDMLQIDPNKRPDPSVAANVLSISLFRFGHNLHKLLHDCGFDETLFGGKINDLKNAASKTLEALKENMIASVNNFTLLFAAETILARNIHPNVISTAELQLRATFLSRINHEYIWSALSYFCHEGSSSRSHSNFVTTKMGDQIFAAGDTINSVNNFINN
uniref:non-specific serine/threonine protein kinase n=1 Tax=Wuchereria bancrofti TaxID=6293 RepID=A0A1I8EVZ2_WUCBA